MIGAMEAGEQTLMQSRERWRKSVGLRRRRIGNQGENVTAQIGERFCPTGGAGGCGRLQGPAALTRRVQYRRIGVRCFYGTLYRRQSCEPLRSRIWSWDTWVEPSEPGCRGKVLSDRRPLRPEAARTPLFLFGPSYLRLTALVASGGLVGHNTNG